MGLERLDRIIDLNIRAMAGSERGGGVGAFTFLFNFLLMPKIGQEEAV